MKISSFLLVLFFIAFSSCKKKKENYVEIKSSNKTVDWSKAHNFYSTNIETAIQLLDSLKKTGLHTKNTIPIFDELRIAFKKAEPYAGALNADITHRSNGPALPIYKEDNVQGDRQVKDYISDNAMMQLLESSRIKERIRDIEQDLWNY